MFKKFKKILPAAVSAVLCVTMLLGTTASAAGSDTELWKDAKSAAGLKYYSKYIKWAETYSEKDTKNTVSYDKSRTKKFIDKILAKTEADSPVYSLGLIDGDALICYALKDGCVKHITFMDGEGGGIIVGKKTVALISVNDKTKVTAESGGGKDDASLKEISEEFTETINDDVAHTFDFDISENAKGKIFKFRSDEKIYYYEEFECGNNFYTVGFIFTEKGTPIAMVADGAAFCLSFRTNIEDSEFDVPKGYKEVDMDDFDY